jgi:hypothetical protein
MHDSRGNPASSRSISCGTPTLRNPRLAPRPLNWTRRGDIGCRSYELALFFNSRTPDIFSNLRVSALLRDSHQNCGYPPDNLRVSRKTHFADLVARLRVRNQQQHAFPRFTPRTGVDVTQFDEIDGTVECALPATPKNLPKP